MRWASSAFFCKRSNQVGPVDGLAGFFCRASVGTAAGLAALKVLERDKPYSRLAKTTAVLVAEIRTLATLRGLPLTINHVASMFTAFFTDRKVNDFNSAASSDARAYARFHRSLLQDGVYFPPSKFEAAMLSIRHGNAELERTLDAVARAFRRL